MKLTDTQYHNLREIDKIILEDLNYLRRRLDDITEVLTGKNAKRFQYRLEETKQNSA